MRSHLLLVLALFGISASLFGQKAAWEPPPGHITLPLWPQTQQPNLGPETDITTAKDDLVAGKPVMRLTNVAASTITVGQRLATVHRQSAARPKETAPR